MPSKSGRRPAPRVLPDVIFPNSLMSAPATNERPPPIRTAAFAEESSLTSSIALAIPSGTPGLRAFAGGLSMVMMAVSLPLSLLSRTRLLILNSDHCRRTPPEKPRSQGERCVRSAYRSCRRSQFPPKHPCPAPEFRPQFFFQYFSRRSLGQGLAEFNRSWTFIVRQIRAAELNEFRLRRHTSRS